MLDALIEAARADARQRHALWDEAAFDALHARADLSALDAATCRAWLRLATEPLPSVTLRRCLTDAGALLAPLLPPARLQALVDCFNLCDGLVNGAPWFDAYVASRLDGLGDLSDLPTLVELALEDVFAPASETHGELVEFVLDPRSIDPRFVPGDLTLAAPRIICAHDRRRDACLGIAFGADQVTLFGPIPALDPIEPPRACVEVEPYRARFGETLHYLGEALPKHAHFVLGSSLLVTAEDSQRIWVIRPR